MNDKMSFTEMIDSLRMLRNMANASKAGLRASGDEKAAADWERGAKAVEQAIHVIEDTTELRQALKNFLERGD